MLLLSNDYWEVRTTPKKGRGLFAKKDIPAGTIIGDYIGKVIKTKDEDFYEKDEDLYLMYYHDQASIYPTDLKAAGSHLLNHSCTPNCWMHTYKGHTLFFALRHIFAGEELTISYLLSPLDKTCEPCTHICHCEGIMCYQTMHLPEKKFDAWTSFNDRVENKTKRERVRYGKELPKLPNYPNEIPDHPVYNLFGSVKKPAKPFTDKRLPSVTELRKRIRETGKTLSFPKLNTRILGIEDDRIISETITS